MIFQAVCRMLPADQKREFRSLISELFFIHFKYFRRHWLGWSSTVRRRPYSFQWNVFLDMHSACACLTSIFSHIRQALTNTSNFFSWNCWYHRRLTIFDNCRAYFCRSIYCDMPTHEATNWNDTDALERFWTVCSSHRAQTLQDVVTAEISNHKIVISMSSRWINDCEKHDLVMSYNYLQSLVF